MNASPQRKDTCHHRDGWEAWDGTGTILLTEVHSLSNDRRNSRPRITLPRLPRWMRPFSRTRTRDTVEPRALRSSLVEKPMRLKLRDNSQTRSSIKLTASTVLGTYSTFSGPLWFLYHCHPLPWSTIPTSPDFSLLYPLHTVAYPRN